MRTGHYRNTLVAAALLVASACASSPYRMAARRITAPQWDTVIECVTMSARASGKEVIVDEYFVSIATDLKRGGIEDILFVWGPHNSPGYTVRSKIKVRDIRQGRGAPIGGATQETRRLRQQLDQQCLQSYPIVDGMSTN